MLRCAQAGVDLGTVMQSWEEQRRRQGGRRGKGKGGGQGGTPAGPQIRPKRRQPVSKVLLVGGATRMPAVRRFVRNMTGLDAEEELVDPDLVRF